MIVFGKFSEMYYIAFSLGIAWHIFMSWGYHYELANIYIVIMLCFPQQFLASTKKNDSGHFIIRTLLLSLYCLPETDTYLTCMISFHIHNNIMR